MATKDDKTEDLVEEDRSADADELPSSGAALATEDSAAEETAEPDPEGQAPAVLGAKKYVHVAFFALGILVAFICSKVLYTAWNSLAEWPAASAAVPQLLRYAEDERATFTTIVGAAIGLLTIVQVYRKDTVRSYADEVASELSKVTWPNKETVTNGTIVVVVASMIATVYVTLLDRFWGFVTKLVYGA